MHADRKALVLYEVHPLNLETKTEGGIGALSLVLKMIEVLSVYVVLVYNVICCFKITSKPKVAFLVSLSIFLKYLWYNNMAYYYYTGRYLNLDINHAEGINRFQGVLSIQVFRGFPP